MIKSVNKFNKWMIPVLATVCCYAAVRYQMFINDNSILPIYRSTPGGFHREVSYIAVLASLNMLCFGFFVWSFITKRHTGYAILFSVCQLFSTYIVAAFLDASIPIF